MTAETTTHFEVFATRDYVENKQIKTHWHRLGTGFRNADGSFNIQLWSLPLPDTKTGLARLQMRVPQPRDNGPKRTDDSAAQSDAATSTAERVENAVEETVPFGDDYDSFIINFDPFSKKTPEALERD
jgi:hypothetical protein